MKNERIRVLTFTGMFAALIFITTYALHIPTGFNGGYIHVGDAFIYLAAAMLPKPFAMLAAAVGAGFSDFMTPGAAVWVLPTAIIKPLCCLPFTNKTDNLLCKRNVLGTIFASLVTVVGYGIAAAFMTGSVSLAIAEAPFQLVQAAGSAACFVGLSAALKRANIKKFLALQK